MADIRVFFVTNRNHQPGNKKALFGPRFNADGVAALRFGRAQFSDDKDPSLKSVFVYPETKGVDDFTKIGSAAFFSELREAMKGERTDTLVFIHGFNVDFESALTAGAKLAGQVRVEGRALNLVIFTWPSDGNAVPLMSYYSDREDARASGPALARAYLKLRDYVAELSAQDQCDRRLHLVAHSMGAYVLRQGLQALIAKEPDGLVRLFDQIVLAAPDEDDDAFESEAKLKRLPQIARRLTVYFNPNDRALVVSDKTKANPDRLGSDGPRLIDLIPKKVVLVDCRNIAVRADRFAQHSYYVGSPAVSADLGAVLAGMEAEAIANREFVAPQRAWRISAELQ